MKPCFLTVLCLVLVFCLTACGSKPDDNEATVSDTVSSEVSVSVSEANETASEGESSVIQETSPPEEPASSEKPQELKQPRENPYDLAYMEIYNLLKDSPYTEHTISVKELYVNPDKVPDGYIRYQAPVDCLTGYGGGGVLCFPQEAVFENPDIYDFDPNIKFGEFQFFGLIKDWVLYGEDGNEVYRLSASVADGAWSDYPLDDPRVFKSDDNTPGALKETAKYQRIVNSLFYNIRYLVNLGHGYGVTIYFYIPKEITGQELEVYDKIVESMTFVLE